MAAYDDVAKLYYGANPDKRDPKVDVQAAVCRQKNGFANVDEYDDVAMNVTIIMSGIDPQTKKFTEPAEQIKNEIAALKTDKSVPEAQKNEGLAQLEAALKIAKPIQFKENIALVLKYFDLTGVDVVTQSLGVARARLLRDTQSLESGSDPEKQLLVRKRQNRLTEK